MESSSRTVLIFDERPLRREAYMCLLAPWAAQQDLVIVGHESFNPASIDGDAALAVICIGNRPMSELRAHGELAQNGVFFPPLVIISDLDDPAEIAAALRWGAHGFVPTTTLPELAMNTMTFVLSGGEFFPVSTLQKPEE